jgi:hypothetical protein
MALARTDRGSIGREDCRTPPDCYEGGDAQDGAVSAMLVLGACHARVIEPW